MDLRRRGDTPNSQMILTEPRAKVRTMSIIVEVRAAEGGADSKSLVIEQFAIYARRCAKVGL